MKQQGFTLLELMIAVLVIGILSAFGIPAYLNQVESSRETDGQALITRIMQDQERYYTENLTYTTDFKDMGYSISNGMNSDEGYYTVSASTCASPSPTTIDGCVLLTGTSTTGGEVLTLDSLGNKSW